MKIEVDEKITLDDDHDVDTYDKLGVDYVTVQVNGERATVKIKTLIKVLEAMGARCND